MKIQIKNRWYGNVVFKADAESLGAAIIAALKAKADLRSADLSGANLRSADLRSADLRSADLSGANLRGANLSSADLSGADLSGADLSGAGLSGADLSGADLRSANLSGAGLSGADLSGANLEYALSQRSILPAGDLIVYKKIYTKEKGIVCTLRIPADAKRVGGLIGRKCRAEYAYVVSGEGYSDHNNDFLYKEGKKVVPDKYDPNPLVECSNGIHFFITKAEAERY